MRSGFTPVSMVGPEPDRRRKPSCDGPPLQSIGKTTPRLQPDLSKPRSRRLDEPYSKSTRSARRENRKSLLLPLFVLPFGIPPDAARSLSPEAFLDDSRAATIAVVLGDARLRLNDAPDHAYGLIVLDAFSSDAIP